VVVDLREVEEIDPAEWEFFEAEGSHVVHFPWTTWSLHQPAWEPDRGYLIVCAHGIRSAAALRTIPPGIRALSLAGGTAALGL
jgi:rhodanese-related sulfurtransferase